MMLAEIEALGWPASRLGDAMAALVRHSGLGSKISEADHHNPAKPGDVASHASAAAWIEWLASGVGCDAEAVETTLGDLESEIAGIYPALLRVSEDRFLAIVRATKSRLRLLTPGLRIETMPLGAVCEALREASGLTSSSELGRLLLESGISAARQIKTARFISKEHLKNHRFNDCWILRPSQGAGTLRWLREARAVPNCGLLVAAHTTQYLLWLASWAIMGRLSFQGRMDRGWLLAWALLLMTLIPFRVLTTWAQGLTAIGVGGLLKRRLLAGANRLEPEEVRHSGAGTFLGQALEAESLETLALSGGVQAALATIELAVSALVLGRTALLLAVWCGVLAALGWRFWKRYQPWTDRRLAISSDLIECMVGHRTRVAQQPRREWHESEDQALDTYIIQSHSLDRIGVLLIAAVPRGWLIAGLASLAPAIVSGHRSGTEMAITLGGVLLAYTAFRRLTGSLTEIAGAWVAWKRVSPLFRAASRPQAPGEFPVDTNRDPAENVIEAERLTFRYRKDGKPVLEDCSLTIRNGDRVLIQGPSGGGKTTFASLVSGMRQAQSGLLLANGLDRQTIGTDRWRKRVAAAPQFHENHILTETLAFNLLMGRRWPPTIQDMEEAESMCRELGLGDLLERMPSGLQQLVGEGGWQLSHGERSRVYIARALLQHADLVILDESFAALDPENLHIALECTLAHAPALMVIAHP